MRSKPENLLCRPDGSGLKVADFGQARNTRSRPPYTPYVGTRWYRSPEEVLDLPAYNSPVDVWAAGAIFAELFAGRPVFPGATAAAQVFAIAALLGPVTPSLWPDGARQCAACGIRTDVGGSSSSGGGGGLRDRLEAACVGASAAALDVMCAMLQWDPSRRPSAADVLAGSPLFAASEWAGVAPPASECGAEGSPLPPDDAGTGGEDDATPAAGVSSCSTPLAFPGAAAAAASGGTRSSASRSPAPPARRRMADSSLPVADAAADAPLTTAASEGPAASASSAGPDHAALAADIDADLEALGLPSAAPPVARGAGGSGRGRRSSALPVTPGSLAEAFAVRQAVVAMRRESSRAGGDTGAAGLDASIEDLLSEVELGQQRR